MVTPTPAGASSPQSVSQPTAPMTPKQIQKLKDDIRKEILTQAGSKNEAEVDFVVFSKSGGGAMGGRSVVRYTAAIIDSLGEEQLKDIVLAANDQRLVVQNVTRGAKDALSTLKVFADKGDKDIIGLYTQGNRKIEELGPKFKEAFKEFASRITHQFEKETKKMEKPSSTSVEAPTAKRSERSSGKSEIQEESVSSTFTPRNQERNVGKEDMMKDEFNLQEEKNAQLLRDELDTKAQEGRENS